jgi:predicted RNase H-like HicB family nuclease
METKTLKDIAYYEGLPYTITIRKDDEGDFVARISELPGCLAHGEDEASALQNLRSVERLWIEEALSAGITIPEPEDDSCLPSGKWLQRVPRKLHRQLVDAARRDNISLNQLVTSMLAESLAVKSCAQVFQTFISRTPQPIHLSADIFALEWPEGSASERGRWSITSHTKGGNIIQSLSRIRNIATPSIFLDEPYADEHRESHERLSRK